MSFQTFLQSVNIIYWMFILFVMRAHSFVPIGLHSPNIPCWRSPTSKSSTSSITRLLSNKVRPALDDVERISRGQAAKRRGTGSRAVPHRLNAAERIEWQIAKQRRYLQLRGTGYRNERGDSPLANSWRNYCDALAIPCISVRRGVRLSSTSTLVEDCVIDFSPLRTASVDAFQLQAIATLAQSFPTLVDVKDYTPEALGLLEEDPLVMLEETVIWRIPMIRLVATFGERADSKRFAQGVAALLCGGEQPISIP